MCGICVVIKKHEGKYSTEELLKCEDKQEEEDIQWSKLLSNRGPDVCGCTHVKLNDDAKDDVTFDAAFYGHVLHLRGDITSQPLIDFKGNILLWNGEIFGGNIQVNEHQNDGIQLLNALSILKEDCSYDDVISIFKQIHGPWAFAYWQNDQKRLWFGRDYFGRRSLLWYFPKVPSQEFVLSSVAQKTDAEDFTEVPAKMIYCISIEQIVASWPTEDDSVKSSGTGLEACITRFPIALPKPDIEENILSLEKLKLDFYKNSDKPNCKCSSEKEFDEIRESVEKCTKSSENGHTVESREDECTEEDQLNDGDNTVENKMNFELRRKVETRKDTNCFNLEENGPPSSDSEIYRQILEYFTNCFMHFLENATKRRVFNLPRDSGKGKDYTYREKNKNAKVGILFSGGIDSMVIAAIADRCIPKDEPIDLLNVAFEHRPTQKSSKGRQKRIETEQKKDAYEVPDRISGKAGVMELNQKRKWNFIEINATLDDVKTARATRVRHLVHPLETVLDDSLGCAIWFAARGKGTKYMVQNGELNKIEESYTSDAKVLLAGMGADEQLGGYARHRSKFEKFGWKGLEEEMKMEIERISSRNLGRDDRCISDHGREARFPFLDENVVNFLEELPVWIKCDPRLPRGYGEKRLLREVARRLGLNGSAVLPKRAIQFGSKIAKMENSKERGGDSCKRLNNLQE